MFPGMPSDRRHKPQARSGSWCNWWSALVAGRGQEEDLGADIAIYGVHEALVVAPAEPHGWVRSTHQFLPAQVLAAGAWSGCAVGRFFFALPRGCLEAISIAAGAPLAAGPGSVSIGEQVMLHTQRQSQGAGD
jgi:hypothetical protein